MSHIMLDLETMGNGPTSAIIAIGACRFDPNTGHILDTFYTPVELQSSMDCGLTVDASTVMWWMKQSEEARGAFSDGAPLCGALVAFGNWLGNDVSGMWGNGASFDNVILSNAYRATSQEQPWPFWADRCYRTIKNMAPHVELERVGTHHNAVDDAVSQAKHLAAVLNAMGVTI